MPFLPVENLLPFPNPLSGHLFPCSTRKGRANPAPQPSAGARETGAPTSPWNAPGWRLYHPPEKGVGRTHFALNKGEGGRSLSPPAKGQKTLVFSPGRDGAPFQPERGGNPMRKKRPTSSPLQGRETKPRPPDPAKNASPSYEKPEHPCLLGKTRGRGFSPKEAGASIEGAKDPPPHTNFAL